MNVKSIDIARALGISKSTVSLALNGKPGVSEQTRQEVLACKKQLEEHGVIYALSNFLIMILSWLVKQSLIAFCFRRYSHEK